VKEKTYVKKFAVVDNLYYFEKGRVDVS